MKKQVIAVGTFAANCTILWNENSDKCWIIDPGADAADLIAFCEERKLTPALIAFTHAHFDHISGVTDLLKKWSGTPVHINEKDVYIAFSKLNCWGGEYPTTERPATLVTDLCEGFILSGGGIEAKVIATPGHTPGGVCFYFENDKLLLAGDTLFASSYGRTDFPGGSLDDMIASLKRLLKLPGDTRVISGHGASTTIAREQDNPGVSW